MRAAKCRDNTGQRSTARPTSHLRQKAHRHSGLFTNIRTQLPGVSTRMSAGLQKSDIGIGAKNLVVN